MDVDFCTWNRDGYYYNTDCGYTYNPYVRNTSVYPIIINDICPYCGKPINYVEENGGRK